MKVRFTPAEPQVVSQVKATKAKAGTTISESSTVSPTTVGGGLVHLQLLFFSCLPVQSGCTCHLRHRKACDVTKRRWDLGRHWGVFLST